jgi:hypothetical protein
MKGIKTMKKIIALILTAVMLLTLVPAVLAAPAVGDVGKVASGYTPTGTAIDDWSKLTDAAGAYYLTKDITVSASFATTFTGTLDGNGHTVTVSAPLFADLAGTVKNLTVKGAIDTSAEAVFVGAVAAKTSAAATVENVKNEASVKGYVTAGTGVPKEGSANGYKPGAGGIVGGALADITIKNCVNTGAVNGACVGGMLGIVDGKVKTRITSCVNTGAITNVGVTGTVGDGYNSIGGILGCINAGIDVVIEDCVNSGAVKASFKHATGGIVGGAWKSPKENYGIKDAVTVKNCVNTGKIDGGWQTGGICGWMRVNLLIENCTNKGDVASNESYSGGILGRGGFDIKDIVDNGDGTYGAVKTTIKNCVNDGKVLSQTGQAGGMIGYQEHPAYIYNSVNNGYIGRTDLKKDGSSNSATNINCGGMIGGIKSHYTIENCLNTGKIDGQTNAAGIVANTTEPKDSNGNKGVYSECFITNCTNTGDVIGSNNRAGGIAGYFYTTGTNFLNVQNCVNTGKIKGKQIASQLFCYGNGANTTVKNNVAAGSVEGFDDAAQLVFIGLSSANVTEYKVSGNYYVENDGTKMYSYTATATNTASIIEFASRPEGTITVVTAAQLASGEVAYAVNKAAGKTVFYQTIGTDAVPTTSSASKTVYLVNGAYTNTAPVAPKPAPTGDSAVAIAIALIAVSCGAVITMKKKVR